MKGVIFNAFQDFVSKNFGMSTYQRVLKETDLEDEVFIGPESYDDEKLLNLVGVSVRLLELSMESAVRSFGRHLFGFLVKRSPHVLEDHKSPRELLLGLDNIIHVEVRKIYEGAETPTFNPELLEDGSIYLSYVSKRGLSPLVEGLLLGMGDFYQVEVSFEKIESQTSGVVCHYKVKC